jgi:hypothetical protein
MKAHQKTVPHVLRLVTALLEAPPNRFGKLEFITPESRDAVHEIQQLAVDLRLPPSRTVLEQAGKVARAVLELHGESIPTVVKARRA